MAHGILIGDNYLNIHLDTVLMPYDGSGLSWPRYKNSLKDFKELRYQSSVIKNTVFKKEVTKNYKLIRVSANPFYNMIRHHYYNFHYTDRLAQVFKSLSYNILIIEDSGILMNLMLNEPLQKKILSRDKRIIRIFEIDDSDEFFEPLYDWSTELDNIRNSFVLKTNAVKNVESAITKLQKTDYSDREICKLLESHKLMSEENSKSKELIKTFKENKLLDLTSKIKNWSNPFGDISELFLDDFFKNN